MPGMKFNERESLVMRGNKLFLRDDIHPGADEMEVLMVKKGGLEDLRQRLVNLGETLENKQEEIFVFLDTTQLKGYFRCRDSLKLLIPALFKLEQALYEHKILV